MVAVVNMNRLNIFISIWKYLILIYLEVVVHWPQRSVSEISGCRLLVARYSILVPRFWILAAVIFCPRASIFWPLTPEHCLPSIAFRRSRDVNLMRPATSDQKPDTISWKSLYTLLNNSSWAHVLALREIPIVELVLFVSLVLLVQKEDKKQRTSSKQPVTRSQ